MILNVKPNLNEQRKTKLEAIINMVDVEKEDGIKDIGAIVHGNLLMSYTILNTIYILSETELDLNMNMEE